MTTQVSFLQDNDLVYIVAPSGPIDKKYIDEGTKTLESWGLQVKVGKHVLDKEGVFAGTDKNRLFDLQEALNDKNAKAIICARGGYGAIRIAPYLDYSTFKQHPKLLVGFSDITTLHSQIHELGYSTIHGAMPKNFSLVTKESLESLQNLLFGKNKTIQIETSKFNKIGTVTNELVGGNLSILYSIRGVDFEYNYTNKILFIEDLNEYLYHIDRMLQNFKHSGIFSKISGLIVGTMSNMKQGADPYNGTIEEIILDAIKEYNIPVCFNFPCGHDEEHEALMLGGTYTLDVSQEKVSLKLQ